MRAPFFYPQSDRSGRLHFRFRRSRNPQRRRAQRRGPRSKLAAAQCISCRHSSRLTKHRHTQLQQPAGHQRASHAQQRLRRHHCSTRSRPIRHAWLELLQQQTGHARRHGQRSRRTTSSTSACATRPAASADAPHSASTPTTSPTRNTGPTPAQATAIRLFG